MLLKEAKQILKENKYLLKEGNLVGKTSYITFSHDYGEVGDAEEEEFYETVGDILEGNGNIEISEDENGKTILGIYNHEITVGELFEFLDIFGDDIEHLQLNIEK